jgi:hypothetical protein
MSGRPDYVRSSGKTGSGRHLDKLMRLDARRNYAAMESGFAETRKGCSRRREERPEDVVLSSAVSRLQIGYCGHNRSSLAGCRRTLIASLQLYILTPPSDPAR